MNILQATPSTYVLTVTIGCAEYDLGTYPDAEGAAARMVRWVNGRGLTFGTDTARRIAEADRTDAVLLTLDVITRSTWDEITEPARTAWVAHASDYIWRLD